MANRTKRTPKKEAKFLEGLAQGLSVARACERSGIGRTAAYEWRNSDFSLKSAWDAAIEEGTDRMEDEALRRAVEGVAEPVFYQGAQCGVVQKYSDTLLIFLLKARRPEKYRDNMTVKGDTGQMEELLDAIRRS